MRNREVRFGGLRGASSKEQEARSEEPKEQEASGEGSVLEACLELVSSVLKKRR